MGRFLEMHKNIASFGGDLDSLAWLITIIIFCWFCIAFILTFYWAVRYRRGNGRKATYEKGEGSKVWFVLLPVILVTCFDAWIDIETSALWAKIKGPVIAQDADGKQLDQKDMGKLAKWKLPNGKNADKGDVTYVRITARQFSWFFEYAGKDGIFDTDDDIYSTDELHVPVDTNVVWDLTSADVMHSFFIKNLRLKQDAVPGRWIRGWFHVKKDLIETDLDGKKGVTVDWTKEINGKDVIKAQKSLRLEEFKGMKTQATTKAQENVTKILKENLFDGKLKEGSKFNYYHGRMYEIACAEICGQYHGTMNGWMVVDTEKGFNKWVKKRQKMMAE